jgi:hypothetical protein
LGSIGDKHSLLAMLEVFLKELTKEHVDYPESQSMQRVLRIERDETMVRGLIESGGYGIGSRIIEVKTLEARFERKETDAELFPFYFLASLPDDGEIGVLIFQRQGAVGIYTAFMTAFRKWMADHLPDYTVETGRLIAPEVMKYLLEGRLKSIEIITHKPSGDLADQVKKLGNIQEKGTFTAKFAANRNQYLSKPGWLKSILKGKTNVVELADINPNLDKPVRVIVEYQGVKRLVDFARPDSIAPYIDCTSRIKVGADGHPLFDSIDKYARELSAEFHQRLGH